MLKKADERAAEIQKLAKLAALYAVADPGKDVRDEFFRRVARLG